ncbi:MAG: hypothetical protein EXR72_10160 [Myxococcales bacterium]|nr:hypothetical protein [Myxococcales bacterium]
MTVRTGHMLIGLGLLKAVVGVAVYSRELGDLGREGVFATVTDAGTRGAALWFLLAAGLMILLGWVVADGERHGRPPSLVPSSRRMH